MHKGKPSAFQTACYTDGLLRQPLRLSKTPNPPLSVQRVFVDEGRLQTANCGWRTCCGAFFVLEHISCLVPVASAWLCALFCRQLFFLHKSEPLTHRHKAGSYSRVAQFHKWVSLYFRWIFWQTRCFLVPKRVLQTRLCRRSAQSFCVVALNTLQSYLLRNQAFAWV